MKQSDDLKKIANQNWIQRWSGSYTLISCYYWGAQYHQSLKKILKVGFEHTLFIHRKGTASFYIPEAEFRKLGQNLADQSAKDNNFAKKFCTQLKKSTDILMPIMESLENKIPTVAEYKTFQRAFDQHLAYHVFVKKTVDFLPVESLNQVLPYFKQARLYSEQIYSKSESFFRLIMKQIANKEKYNADYLTCLSQEEFEAYLQGKKLPPEKLLKQRYIASALYFEKGNLHLLLGNDVKELEKLLLRGNSKQVSELRGICGYPGKVKGIARIVPDPFKVKKFNRGDILITGMTRPEFIPLIEKASAIVTESGGILSHAAITARELKKPCVVGTKIATKILKNGDMVEVDADMGIIKVIK